MFKKKRTYPTVSDVLDTRLFTQTYERLFKRTINCNSRQTMKILTLQAKIDHDNINYKL